MVTGPEGRSAGLVLILGGTAEARALAAALVSTGRPVLSSLAGRVKDPALPVGEVRIGGFSGPRTSGVDGLADYLSERRIAAVVDATHPFAATISVNAAAATVRSGTPLLRLQRPGWRAHPDAARWSWVGSADQAAAAGAGSRRPFLTTGRQSLDRFLVWADRDATVRVVDAPERPLPERWHLIRSRGPYAYADEFSLMSGARIDLLVTKDSGGAHTMAKLEAARDLGIPVVVIERPPVPEGVPCAGTVDEALTWLDPSATTDTVVEPG